MKKSKMLNWFLVCISWPICLVSVRAQIPVEISTGHASYYYQHSFAARLSSKKTIGIFHTSSILIPYDKKRGNEIMSQSYVTYSFNDLWTSGIGSILTPLNRVRPSIFLQYFVKRKTSSVLVYPRIDFWKNPNLELMGFIEYRGPHSRKQHIYARFQYMTTWNLREHVRSYQYIRIGVNHEDTQFGLAANFDQYGRFATTYNSIGFFVRKEF